MAHKRGTKITLFATDTNTSAEKELSHAEAILKAQQEKKKSTWILPEDSKYIFTKDGKLILKPINRINKNSEKSGDN